MKKTTDTIKKVNGDILAIREEFDRFLADFTKRHPTVGLGIILMVNKEDDVDLGTKLAGNVSYHDLMHGLMMLGNQIVESGMENDPDGINSFMEEMEFRKQMARFFQSVAGEDGTEDR